MRGHNQITDLYLLALAVRHGGSLATGERQRLALLRAMRPAVRVLLLDEPTSA